MKKNIIPESQTPNSTPDLDLSFGTRGMVEIPSPVDPSLPLDTRFVVADPNTSTNQHIYAACWRYDSPNTYYYLVRLLEDGEIDRSFGENGYFTLPIINRDRSLFNKLIFSSDSRTITGIANSLLFANSWWVPGATRLELTGVLDTSFSGTGYRYYQPPWLPQSAKAAANIEKADTEDISDLDLKTLAEANFATQLSIQPDGKMLFLASYRQFPNGYGVNCYLARINLDGSPDDTFGQNGFVKIEDPAEPEFTMYCNIYDIDRSEGMVVLADRRNTVVVLRYDAEGRLDQRFGKGGILVIEDSVLGGKARAIKALDDGTIIILFDFNGENDENSYPYFYPAVIKLLRDGGRDPAFNNGEPLKFDDLAPDARIDASGMALDAGNRIVIAGRVSRPGALDQGFLARVFPNGTRDADFGVNGLDIRKDMLTLSAPSIQNGTQILSTAMPENFSYQSVVRFIA